MNKFAEMVALQAQNDALYAAKIAAPVGAITGALGRAGQWIGGHMDKLWGAGRAASTAAGKAMTRGGKAIAGQGGGQFAQTLGSAPRALSSGFNAFRQAGGLKPAAMAGGAALGAGALGYGGYRMMGGGQQQPRPPQQ